MYSAEDMQQEYQYGDTAKGYHQLYHPDTYHYTRYEQTVTTQVGININITTIYMKKSYVYQRWITEGSLYRYGIIKLVYIFGYIQ